MAVKDIDYKFVTDPAEELTCSICMKVLCEPHMVNCCAQQFCKDCLEKWLLKNTTCPHCRKEGFSHMLMQPTSRKTRELKVYCPNSQHGCKAVLKISECEEHLSTTNDRGCAYVRLECPNACTAELFRGEMEAHTQKECPRRMVTCPHCDLQGEHQHITGNHKNECLLFPLPCPQRCGAMVLRKDYNTHPDTCPLEPVPCPFQELGCKTKVCRRDLEKHMETNTVQHMTVLAKSHTALQAEHRTLKAEHGTLKYALKAENKALKKSYSAKMEAIGRIGLSGNSPESLQLAQIRTIVADPLQVKLGDTACLVLSESNEKCGQHQFILSHEESHLHMRLEWEMKKLAIPEADMPPADPSWIFKLCSIEPLPITCKLKFVVDIHLSAWQEEPGTFLSLTTVCCGKPRDVPLTAGGEQMLGTLSTDKGLNCKQMNIRFTTAIVIARCPCLCHYIQSSRKSEGCVIA